MPHQLARLRTLGAHAWNAGCRIKPYWIKAAPLRGAGSGAPRAGLWPWGGPGRRARAVPATQLRPINYVNPVTRHVVLISARPRLPDRPTAAAFAGGRLVRFGRMADSRWWKDFDAVLGAAVPADSRILDVGCGDGGLVDRLAELGFDAFGVDPAAPAHPRLVRQRVEHARRLGQFDAVTAVMSLHHAEHENVAPALANHLRPRGSFFMYEFSWDAYDGRAAAWLVKYDQSAADNSVPGWRREHRELHTSAAIKKALYAHFEPVLEIRRPYLARMLGRHDLETTEHALTRLNS